MACIYRHIRLDTNEVFYIGIAKNKKRPYSTYDRNIHWKRIAKKTEYNVEIIIDDLSWENACKKEKEFISLYGRKDLKKGTLCNMTDGGDGAKNVIFSEQRLIKMSLNAKGELNNFYGKKHTEETLKIIGQKSKGRIKSPEQIEKWKNSKKKYKITEETKNKIRNTLLGKKHTEERRKNQSIGQKKRFLK